MHRRLERGSCSRLAARGENTPAKNLADLFHDARGQSPPLLENYRLTGVQTALVNGKAPALPGNSFTEFNANVPAKQASCITCHNGAQEDRGLLLDVATRAVKAPPPGQPRRRVECHTLQDAWACQDPKETEYA